jgi:hypothetical protein
LSSNTGLTQKQIIAYCEPSPQIAISPVINVQGDIYYGLKSKVMRAYKVGSALSKRYDAVLYAFVVVTAEQIRRRRSSISI